MQAKLLSAYCTAGTSKHPLESEDAGSYAT
jgi:hypothetical protein